MRRLLFAVAVSVMCVTGANAQQHAIDTEKSTLTIHVGKTGVFSGFGHEHQVRAPIRSGKVDTGPHPEVELRVNAAELRVVDSGESDKDRAEVQNTMLGPEVLDSEHDREIVFKSMDAQASGPDQWTLRGNLSLRAQTHPVTARVRLKDGHYTGEATMKLTDFGIKPPGVAGVRAKDEIRIEFDVLLAP